MFPVFIVRHRGTVTLLQITFSRGKFCVQDSRLCGPSKYADDSEVLTRFSSQFGLPASYILRFTFSSVSLKKFTVVTVRGYVKSLAVISTSTGQTHVYAVHYMNLSLDLFIVDVS
jgi:hypothetical protein